MTIPIPFIRIKRVLKFLEDHNSTSPDKAIPYLEVPFSNKRYVRRLLDKGIIKRAGEKVYLDLENKNAFLKRKRLFAFGILASEH